MVVPLPETEFLLFEWLPVAVEALLLEWLPAVEVLLLEWLPAAVEVLLLGWLPAAVEALLLDWLPAVEVLFDFLSLVVLLAFSVVVFFGTWGESVGVSRGEVPLVRLLLELLRSGSDPAPSSAGTRSGGGSETEEEDAWKVIESATTGESSERQMSSSWEQKRGERRRKDLMPPASAMNIFFSSGRRERLSLRVGFDGLRGPWVLKISAKNLSSHHPTHTHHNFTQHGILYSTSCMYSTIDISTAYICMCEQ